MAKHNETGAKGEGLAAAYLEGKGYRIVYRNWRSKRIEVDIIAEKEGKYFFVEVKTRRGEGYGWPEEAVNDKKKKDLIIAANAYVELHPEVYTVQFDIISITLTGDTVTELLHLEDAFY